MKQRSIGKGFGPGVPLLKFSNTPTPPSPDKESSNAVIGRELRLIDPKLIDPNPLAPREIYTEEMIQTRAEELKNQGQRDPIHVIPNPKEPGRFIIADGWTRVQACLEHQALDQLLAEIHSDLSLESSAWLGWENNEGRAEHTDIDRGLFFAKMIGNGKSPSEIADRAKIARSAMTFFQAYSKLPAEVLSEMRKHPKKFGSLVAYHLLRLCDASGIESVLRLMDKYIKEDHGAHWVVAQAKNLMTTSSPRSKPTKNKTIKYQNGHLKTRPDGRVELAIHVAPEKLKAFEEALVALLNSVATPTQDDAKTEQEDAASQVDHAMNLNV